MTNIDKMYWQTKKEFKLLGVKVAEFSEVTTRYDGKGQFISESCPNQEYFDREFRVRKD